MRVLLVLAGAAAWLEECESYKSWTNGFQVVTTTDAVTLPDDMGDWQHGKIYIVNGTALKRGAKQYEKKYFGQYPFMVLEDLEALNLMDVRFGLILGAGDREWIPIPHLGKVRHLIEKGRAVTSLLPFDYPRLYDVRQLRYVQQWDIPFDQKINQLVWRGATTGRTTNVGNRFDCVTRWFSDTSGLLDIGFSDVKQDKTEYAPYVKGKLGEREQLRYKYILSLQGNDVASGIGWQLLSNSVVFSPPFMFEGWLLESRLDPYVHFVPVKADFSDVLEQVQWAEAHQDECHEINRAAKKYINHVWFDLVWNFTARRNVVKLSLGAMDPPPNGDCPPPW